MKVRTFQSSQTVPLIPKIHTQRKEDNLDRLQISLVRFAIAVNNFGIFVYSIWTEKYILTSVWFSLALLLYIAKK